MNHPELKEGSRAWTNGEFKILEDCIPIINDSAKNWTLMAEILKNAVDEYKDDCLSHVDLYELSNISLNILSKEENLFNMLLKLKI